MWTNYEARLKFDDLVKLRDDVATWFAIDPALMYMNLTKMSQAFRIVELEAALQRIVGHYDARSEMHTSDADAAGTMADIARAAIERKDGECAPEVAMMDMSPSARIAELEAACRVAARAYTRLSNVRLPGDVAGDLVHANETLRRALGGE